VNPFLIAAMALLLCLALPGLIILRARPIDGIAALQLCGSTMTLILLCLAQGFHQGVYFNVPLVCALSVWVSGLIFVRFVGRSR
jgi:multisubunit Na+/H+ antiporter MnhF subunit